MDVLLAQGALAALENKLSVKKTLNSVAGTYICINLENGNMYVGSAGIKRMYMRFISHLYLLAQGSCFAGGKKCRVKTWSKKLCFCCYRNSSRLAR